MSDKIRESFENWVRTDKRFKFDDISLDRCEDGFYVECRAEEMFVSWQSALTQQSESEPVAEKEIEELLEKRDDLEDMCDRLSARISELTGVDVGEHTSANCPWTNALEAPDPQPTPQVPEGFEIEKNVRGEIRVELLGGTERGHVSAWLTPHEDFEGRILYWLAHDLLASSTIKEPE